VGQNVQQHQHLVKICRIAFFMTLGHARSWSIAWRLESEMTDRDVSDDLRASPSMLSRAAYLHLTGGLIPLIETLPMVVETRRLERAGYVITGVERFTTLPDASLPRIGVLMRKDQSLRIVLPDGLSVRHRSRPTLSGKS
jgi:hypothetical protein